MTESEARTAQQLGYPWDRFSAALEARQDAEQLARLALEPGSSVDPEAAAMELETALMAERRTRGDAADALLLMLQAAIDERFDDLFGKVMAFAVKVEWREQVRRFFTTQPGGTKWCGELQVRVEELTREVDRLRSENWELACKWAQLKRDVDGNHGQGVAGDGERDTEPAKAAERRAG